MGMFHRLPETMQALDACGESFLTGVGHDYDSHGPKGAVGIERSFEPWNNAYLRARRAAGARRCRRAADRRRQRRRRRLRRGGCRAADGRARFRNRPFVGYDISRYALDRADEKLASCGLANVAFRDPRQSPMPDRPLASTW